jgi:hypothetical protein
MKGRQEKNSSEHGYWRTMADSGEPSGPHPTVGPTRILENIGVCYLQSPMFFAQSVADTSSERRL